MRKSKFFLKCKMQNTFVRFLNNLKMFKDVYNVHAMKNFIHISNICRKLYHELMVRLQSTTTSSSSSFSDIHIPNRIERGSTDILKVSKITMFYLILVNESICVYCLFDLGSGKNNIQGSYSTTLQISR